MNNETKIDIISGIIIHSKFIFTSVTFISLSNESNVLNTAPIYVVTIKPITPKCGIKIITIITLNAESIILNIR